MIPLLYQQDLLFRCFKFMVDESKMEKSIQVVIKLTFSQDRSCYHFPFNISRDSEENLRAALWRMGVRSRVVEDVMDKVRNQQYQGM